MSRNHDDTAKPECGGTHSRPAASAAIVRAGPLEENEGSRQDPSLDIRLAELHWYEAHGIGKKEVKRKRYLD
jgi:hypothetical protein